MNECIIITIFIPECKAIERIWILGDSFVGDTFGKTVNSSLREVQKYYIKENYEVSAHFNNNHHDKNILSRIRNSLVTAFNKSDKLPKILAIILDNDLLRFIGYTEGGVSMETGLLLEWIAREINRVILARLDQLPIKCKRPGEPHVIWFGLPLCKAFNDNDVRKKFNKCLEALIPLYSNMSIIQVRKGWDATDETTYSNSTYSAGGLSRYWRGIDAGIQFWDLKNKGQLIQKSMRLISTSAKQLKSLAKLPDRPNKSISNEQNQEDTTSTSTDPMMSFFKRNRNNNVSPIGTARFKNKEFQRKRRYDRYHWTNKQARNNGPFSKFPKM